MTMNETEQPLDLDAIDIAEWDAWNAGVAAAREAYTQDRQTEAGLCITCDRPKADDRRECWRCWGRRRAMAGSVR